MKKMMIAGALGFCAAVTFGLESANVVGYGEVGLRNGAKGIGACFVPISDTAINLQDFKVTGYDVVEGYEEGRITVQILDKFGRTEKTYFWYDIPNDVSGWFDDSDNYAEDITINIGEALYAMSPEETFAIQTAGQVPTADTAIALRSGSKLVVNPTPLDINLNDVADVSSGIAITGYNLESGYEDGEISVQTLDKFGRTIKTYFWYDISGDAFGWFDNSDNYADDVTVAPGESLCVMSPNETFNIVFPGVAL